MADAAEEQAAERERDRSGDLLSAESDGSIFVPKPAGVGAKACADIRETCLVDEALSAESADPPSDGTSTPNHQAASRAGEEVLRVGETLSAESSRPQSGRVTASSSGSTARSPSRAGTGTPFISAS
jgi:hypothetical protein